ncbi:hypothetical protein PTKIN_Ptkin03bG0234200 [Pterospermum kingtungense]
MNVDASIEKNKADFPIDDDDPRLRRLAQSKLDNRDELRADHRRMCTQQEAEIILVEEDQKDEEEEEEKRKLIKEKSIHKRATRIWNSYERRRMRGRGRP